MPVSFAFTATWGHNCRSCPDRCFRSRGETRVVGVTRNGSTGWYVPVQQPPRQHELVYGTGSRAVIDREQPRHGRGDADSSRTHPSRTHPPRSGDYLAPQLPPHAPARHPGCNELTRPDYPSTTGHALVLAGRERSPTRHTRGVTGREPITHPGTCNAESEADPSRYGTRTARPRIRPASKRRSASGPSARSKRSTSMRSLPACASATQS